ncbi:hypothetical protein AB833_04945 [Chromatiales bacterium (ex Bugula neritina AB1)]|nr:hypothetical protein AB833_04945 [Chromatiales bacterium (ex Bugula neritina AB1)]
MNRWLVLGVEFSLSLLALSLYLVFANNEYNWIKDIDSSLTIPADENLTFKQYLFGFPAMLLAMFLFLHSYSRFGHVVKVSLALYSSLVIFWVIRGALLVQLKVL